MEYFDRQTEILTTKPSGDTWTAKYNTWKEESVHGPNSQLQKAEESISKLETDQ